MHEPTDPADDRVLAVKLKVTDMIKAVDFDFIDQLGKPPVIDLMRDGRRNGRRKHDTTLAVPEIFPLPAREDEKLLHIITQSLRIRHQEDLCHLLQGEDLQYFIPHQVMISAWGDFSGANLKLDVIPEHPGLGAGLLSQCSIGDLIKGLQRRWLAGGRQPLLLDSTMGTGLAGSSPCGRALEDYLQAAGSLLVHGVTDLRDGRESLYVALNSGSAPNGGDTACFRRFADLLITQIDVAFRRVASVKFPDFPPNRDLPSRSRLLSPREAEILRHLAEGRTNQDISRILAISVHTVKNHVQRIRTKLDASNRTEAVAKSRLFGLQPPKTIPAQNLSGAV